MTLTVGTAPFGQHPAGTFNREMPELRGLTYFEDFLPRVRARVEGETVVDSIRVKLLHEHGRLPVLHFPREDVRLDLLDASRQPIEAPPPFAGYVTFRWDSMDEWLQEDEPLIVHPRDPYHRIEVLDTSRRVKVSVGGEVVAESTRARVLFETSLPARWYLPREDVRADILEPSDTTTGCAYKGFASYFHVRVGEGLEENLVWTYREPRREVERIRDYLCFFNERIDLEIDGEPQEQPVTPWSRIKGRDVATADSDLLP